MSQLPKKSEEVKYCTMIPDQQEVYDNLIRNFSCEMNAEGQMSSKGAGAGAAMLMQLRKASNHPLLHRSHYTDRRIKEMAEVLCEVRLYSFALLICVYKMAMSFCLSICS